MELYRAKAGIYGVSVLEFKVERETDHFYVIQYRGSDKRVSKKAKKPFASKTKKEAV